MDHVTEIHGIHLRVGGHDIPHHDLHLFHHIVDGRRVLIDAGVELLQIHLTGTDHIGDKTGVDQRDRYDREIILLELGDGVQEGLVVQELTLVAARRGDIYLAILNSSDHNLAGIGSGVHNFQLTDILGVRDRIVRIGCIIVIDRFTGNLIPILIAVIHPICGQQILHVIRLIFGSLDRIGDLLFAALSVFHIIFHDSGTILIIVRFRKAGHFLPHLLIVAGDLDCRSQAALF